MTTVTIQIPEPLEQRIRAQAMSESRDFSSMVLDLVEKGLLLPGQSADASELSGNEWSKVFREWVTTRPGYGGVADYSRDSIYEGRGE